MPHLFWPYLALGSAVALSCMLALWAIHLKTKNAGIVDFGWAFCIAFISAFYTCQGDGWVPRRVAALSLSFLWGMRLALYLLLTRVIGHAEEGRYRQLRKEWKRNLLVKFLLFFEFQALLAALFSVPFLLASLNPREGFTVLERLGLSLWLVAFIGEITADRQLTLFKRNPKNRGKTCRDGLWSYSRHPNYFFEWLIWCANALFALSSPFGWLALACPALILYFLFKVTGIPATEAQALRTRGADYRKYQRTTSVFIPWPRKISP